MTVLDFFAREGDWQTSYIADRVKKIYAWEVNPEFKKNLVKNLPSDADIQIGDSFEIAKTFEDRNIFDMLIFDNPQGCYGQHNKYCEHFDALPFIPSLLKKTGGLVILNVKTQPFDYDNKLLWQQRRQKFYGVQNTASLSLEFVKNFYKGYFKAIGYETRFSFLYKRPQEPGLYSFVSKLEKI